MGDVVFKGFQCLNANCTEFIFVRESEIPEDFSIVCPRCGFNHHAGGTSEFFHYELIYIDPQLESVSVSPSSVDVIDDVNRSSETEVPAEADDSEVSADDLIAGEGGVADEGEFLVSHDDYVQEAKRYKYCINCNTLKPVELFDVHSSRASGRQGECRLCKRLYNAIKNPSRLTDQHREAANRRRFYALLSGDTDKLNGKAIFDKFEGQCFRCGKQLTYAERGGSDFDLDHTLPNRFLWRITTQNATLLCKPCNNLKHDRWPAEVYTSKQLRQLAYKTGLDYELISGNPLLNEDAVQAILADVDGFIIRWIRYRDEIKRLRNLIREYRGIDIYDYARGEVPANLRDNDA